MIVPQALEEVGVKKQNGSGDKPHVWSRSEARLWGWQNRQHDAGLGQDKKFIVQKTNPKLRERTKPKAGCRKTKQNKKRSK